MMASPLQTQKLGTTLLRHNCAPVRRKLDGEWMHALAAELFPICRSITGNGLRATLRRIQQEIPIVVREVPSGARVLDWIVPDEWNIRDAWIEDASGERLVDFRQRNLHVVNYSVPVRGSFSLDDLLPHLFTLPDQPDAIPYRTSYYRRDWGFCLAHSALDRFVREPFNVCIDSTLEAGALSYGEIRIPGRHEEEFLISAHCCHPSLANDNLSAITVAVALASELLESTPRYSYRFLFAPGTIGAIAWLAQNQERLHLVRHGLVLTCLGDEQPLTYKRSRQGNAAIDRAVTRVLSESGKAFRVLDFSPIGYDERQFCSPGFNLPLGCLMRARHGTFPEYHTSKDDLQFIKASALEESLARLRQIVSDVEAGELMASNVSLPMRKPGRRFVNLKPQGEPQLGRYGVYEMLNDEVLPALWVLNFSDGKHSLPDIADLSGVPFDKLLESADVLMRCGLLKEVGPQRVHA